MAKLIGIAEYLQTKIPDFRYQAYVDTGPLVDRYLAYLAGLGYYGVNSHIITDKYGSYVFIGYMLTNYPFEPDKPLDLTCIKCGRCDGSALTMIGELSLCPHETWARRISFKITCEADAESARLLLDALTN